ncbi:helix-turn-helix transcriptional regulator [Pseudophaeobacter sp. 1A16562]|uniref:helix-turn-helix transcriptional regulator n=1 Tax=Pseudophaeobacter sp. 1A16562 TaxID=3098143 RepID=UPI0034D48A16
MDLSTQNFRRTLGEIAAITTSSLSRKAQVQEIVASLNSHAPIVASNFLIVSHDDSLKSRFSAGYSHRMLSHLQSEKYRRELSALGLFSKPQSLRRNDVQWGQDPDLNVLSCCIQEEGHHDCVTTPLLNSSGRLVGFQNLSFAEAGSVDDDIRALLDEASTAIANVLDPISFRNILKQDDSEIEAVHAINNDGIVLTLHGTDALGLKKNVIPEQAWSKIGPGASNWLVRGKDGLHSVRLWSTRASYFGEHGNYLILCDLGQIAPPLTPRELETAGMLADGRRSLDIAGNLGITLRTANAHVESILVKLGTTNRAAAAAKIVRYGWRLLG